MADLRGIGTDRFPFFFAAIPASPDEPVSAPSLWPKFLDHDAGTHCATSRSSLPKDLRFIAGGDWAACSEKLTAPGSIGSRVLVLFFMVLNPLFDFCSYTSLETRTVSNASSQEDSTSPHSRRLLVAQHLSAGTWPFRNLQSVKRTTDQGRNYGRSNQRCSVIR
jgi:hypothetical protein